MLNSNNGENKKGVLAGDTTLVISEILKKHNLEKTTGDIFEDIKQEKSWDRGAVILDIAMDITQGNIVKKDLITSLQKKIEISEIKAEKLADDIATKLLPLLKRDPRKEVKNLTKNPILPKIKSSVVPEQPLTSKKSSVIKKPTKREELSMVEKPEKSPDKSDVYREPIE